MKPTIIIKCLLLSLIMLSIYSCEIPDPNEDDKGKHIIDDYLHYADRVELPYQDTVYVPVYSKIYCEVGSKSILLTATLSIRNTSYTDTVFINSIEYFRAGKRETSYHDKTLVLGPMQSIDYVIDREDTKGGTGANFMIQWGASRNIKPIFQCVMISTSGQHGLSFTTEGVSLKN